MKKAVIYARYSSDTQTEQSIEGQLRVCQNYAKNNDLLVVDTYVDRAMTGTNDMRPDFQRMIKASSKRQWEYVIVYKLDRFSRDKYEMTIHKHTLKENGVKLVSAMENIPDSPEGIILESLLEGMNQYYSAELSQKVLRGLREQCKYQVPRNETNGSTESVPQSHSRYRTRNHHGTDQRTPERTRNANLAAGLRHRTGKATHLRRDLARKGHPLPEQSYMRKRAGYKRKEGSREISDPRHRAVQ